MKVISYSGISFEVDISAGACKKFGFKHGDRIRHPESGLGTVIGVAPATERINPEPMVLWCRFDCDHNKLKYSYPSLIEPA